MLAALFGDTFIAYTEQRDKHENQYSSFSNGAHQVDSKSYVALLAYFKCSK